MKPGSPKWLEEMQERYDNALLGMDGYDHCIVGVCERFGQEPILCYDKGKIILELMRDMTGEEAEEFFEFNQIGAWVGDRTPAFLIK